MIVLSDYSGFEEEKLYMDSLFGYIWKLAERTEKRAVLKNIPVPFCKEFWFIFLK